MLIKGVKNIVIGSVMEYLLRAFTSDTGASDQGYSDAQVLDTAAEGVLDGSLTVGEGVGDTVQLASSILSLAQNADGIDCHAYAADVIAKTIGRAICCEMNHGINTNNVLFMALLDSLSGGLSSTNRVYQFGPSSASGIAATFLDGNGVILGDFSSVASLSDDTYYKFIIVLGGYDSNGVPYKSGDTKANFKYGAAYFIYLSGEWKLYARAKHMNCDVYACLIAYRGTSYAKNLLIPDYDFSAVLQPLVLDTFTDTDGTALSAHTPDVCPVGSSWSVVAGTDWDIQSNKLTCNGAHNDMAVIDAGVANVFIECTVTPQYTDASNYSTIGIMLRYSDSIHHWLINTDPNGDTFKLNEIDGGSYTSRASASVTIAGNTAYNIKVTANGTTISAWLNNANRISYASASSNQTETEVGVRFGKNNTPPADSTWDNFAVWPLTSTTYDSEFSKSGYGY